MFELFFLLREDAFCCEMKRKFKKPKTERREYINIYVFIFLSFPLLSALLTFILLLMLSAG